MMIDEIDISSQTEYAQLAGRYYKNTNQKNYGTSSNKSVYFGPKSKLTGRHVAVTVNDQTPLLNGSSSLKASKCIDVRIFSLGVLFIGGITVGGIMMYYEDLPCPMGAEFELVNREEWGASHLPVGRRLDSNNVNHVLIEHTATENCFNLTACKMFVYNYQKMWQQQQNTEIPFNFLIGGDGRAYEARGWSVQSEQQFIPSNSSISIAFIGNFTETTPPEKQTSTGYALISELRFQKKISTNYRILGMRYQKRAHYDGYALFQEASTWKCWDEVYTIYS